MKYPPKSKGSSYNFIFSSIDFLESEQYLLPIIKGSSATYIFFSIYYFVATSLPEPVGPEYEVNLMLISVNTFTFKVLK